MPTFQQLMAADATREQIEDYCRREARSVTVDSQVPLVLCRVLGKYLMYVLAEDSAITPHLAMDGIWEPWVTMAISRHVKPGMSCLDVGACYGYYSVLMSDLVSKSGQVDAWEPVHHDLVRTNRNINGGDNINVLPYGLGTGGGQAYFSDSPMNGLGLFNAGGSSEVSATEPPRLQGSPYKTSRMADMEMPGPDVRYDFVKIDVEGSEGDVWRALYTQLQHPSVTVCMEFTPSRHEHPQTFLHGIVDQGFRMGTVGHDGEPRSCSIEEALVPDTGDFRMLWLEKKSP